MRADELAVPGVDLVGPVPEAVALMQPVSHQRDGAGQREQGVYGVSVVQFQDNIPINPSAG